MRNFLFLLLLLQSICGFAQTCYTQYEGVRLQSGTRRHIKTTRLACGTILTVLKVQQNTVQVRTAGGRTGTVLRKAVGRTDNCGLATATTSQQTEIEISPSDNGMDYTPPSNPVYHKSHTNTSASTTMRTGAVCRDGKTSRATGRGACSHHGGVAYWTY
jgi:hypothetical protein